MIYKDDLGSVKANRRELMRYSGRVFNFKLVSFAAVKEAHGVRAHPGLKLKTWVRFCPDTLSLSRDYQSRHKCVCVCV